MKLRGVAKLSAKEKKRQKERERERAATQGGRCLRAVLGNLRLRIAAFGGRKHKGECGESGGEGSWRTAEERRRRCWRGRQKSRGEKLQTSE